MKIKKILLNNLVVIIYVALSFLIELTSACITDGGFYIKDPRYIFTLVGIIVLVMLLISNHKVRLYFAAFMLLFQGVVDVAFLLLYDMAGQWFDWSMFQLRKDAMGIIESVPVNFWFTYFAILLIGTFVVFGLRLTKLCKKNDLVLTEKQTVIKSSIMGGLIIVLLVLNIVTGYVINGGYKDKYKELLYSNASSKYNQYGMMSNFINEFYKGAVFNTVETRSDEEIENFIYKDVYQGSKYHGVSEGNNVVSILCETFEWLAFMPDGHTFGNGDKLVLPNGIKLTEAQCRSLYPNLWSFYDNSYVMTNYHAREKTDISENFSILGSYPIGSFINYDYYENTLPQSMPNMLRNAYGSNYSSQYFHNGNAAFYNREYSVYGLGFDKFYACEKMEEEFNVHNYMPEGERNLDGDMVLGCADEMFPTDKKFYTEITTITTHGMYSKKRNNLEALGYYDRLKNVGLDIDALDITKEDFIYYSYLACAMELDRAIGLVIKELTDRNLLDNTTILIFGDHQGYYEGLSNYVKNIAGEKQALEEGYNYLDLYRVPMMIYDKKLISALNSNNDSRFNNKFSSSCDIVPTLLDLLGIKYYSNIYYGNSVFSDTTSLIYSRGYGYFLDDKSYFYNINSFNYINPSITNVDKYKQEIMAKGDILIERIRYTDISFKKNYFGSTNNYQKFYKNINSINA